jgi:prephenate dehydratase
MTAPPSKIAYQGEPGANSHIACLEAWPSCTPLACTTFDDAFAAVQEGEAAYAMIPIENSLAGRVADVHHLLPRAGLYIVGEHFMPIRFQLMAPKGATLAGVTRVRSHIQALGQCRATLRAMNVAQLTTVDTAGAAREVRDLADPREAALAPLLAAEIYGLDVLKENMADSADNTTRFIVLCASPQDADPEDGPSITTLVFKTRSLPASLYKALGGFATNGVNITKLEGYVERGFEMAQFYLDIDGHPNEPPVKRALEELQFFSTALKVLGVYPAHPYRKTQRHA